MDYKKFILIFFILMINGLTNLSSVNLLLAIPQLLFVVYFLIKGELGNAIFYHLLFWITSYTIYQSQEDFILPAYSYAKFKAIGPVSWSMLVLIAIFVVSFVKTKRIPRESKNLLFYELYKMFNYFFITGLVLGVFGLIFLNYYLKGFIQYASYIMILLLSADVLLRNYSKELVEKFSSYTLPLLVVAPVVTIINNIYFPNILGGALIVYYSALLIPALLQEKKIFPCFIGLISLIASFFWSVSGKGLILLLIIIVLSIYISYSPKLQTSFVKRRKIMRILLSVILIMLPTIIVILMASLDSSVKLSNKIDQVLSLNRYVLGDSFLVDVRDSPYIRISSLINILYEDIRNPIYLLFGRGYGGYFEDHLGLFTRVSLSHNAFSDEAILQGQFYTAHDTPVIVPMLNGFLGLFYLLKLVFLYIKKQAKVNYASFAVVPFLLLTFYFDTLISITGFFFLFCSESERFNTNTYGKMYKSN